MIAKTQPLLVAWLSTLIVTAAARYVPGIRLSDEQALYLAGALFTVAVGVARRYVTPTARPRAADGTTLVPAVEDGQDVPDPVKPSAPSRIATERPPVPPPPDPGKGSRGR